jgi:hypothetical protein
LNLVVEKGDRRKVADPRAGIRQGKANAGLDEGVCFVIDGRKGGSWSSVAVTSSTGFSRQFHFCQRTKRAAAQTAQQYQLTDGVSNGRPRPSEPEQFVLQP